MEISVHRRFQAPEEPREGATCASRGTILLSLIATPAENVWPSHSKSARSRPSSKLSLHPDPVTFERAWICTDDTRASRLQAKTRGCYLTRNIGPAVAGSARPAPPLLLHSG